MIKVDSEGEAARIASLHWKTVDPRGGLLLAVPLDEDAVLDADLVRKANDEAEDSATQAGVDGPDRTPHLLSHMAQKTGGRSSSPISNCCWPMPKSPLVWPEVWHLKHLDGQTDGCSTVRIRRGRSSEPSGY